MNFLHLNFKIKFNSKLLFSIAYTVQNEFHIMINFTFNNKPRVESSI